MRAWNRQELSELEELESLELEDVLEPASSPAESLSLIAECSMLTNAGSWQYPNKMREDPV